MKVFRKKILEIYFLLFSLTFLISSCNSLFSLKNISNEYRWKNKKFENPIKINFDYSPEINTQIDTISYFFYKKDIKTIDKQFKVENFLVEKFKKRNILLESQKNDISIKIDTLVFIGYYNNVDVESNVDANIIGSSRKEHFYFKISGEITKKKSSFSRIFIEKEHNTEPRESYLFSGTIVDNGSGANAEQMIENAINEFSYRSYLKLKESIKKE
jgi:hypothetical protein